MLVFVYQSLDFPKHMVAKAVTPYQPNTFKPKFRSRVFMTDMNVRRFISVNTVKV